MRAHLIEIGEDADYIKIDDKSVILLQQGYRINKEGNVFVRNQKGRLIEQGIYLPIYIFLCALPIILFLIEIHNKMIFIGYTYIIWLYSILMIYLKMKVGNYEDLNENTLYKHNYLTYSIHYNKLFIVISHFVLWPVVLTQSIESILLLAFILFRMHSNFFIDIIDKKFNLNVLSYKKTERRNTLEHIFSIFIIGLSVSLLNLYTIQLTF